MRAHWWQRDMENLKAALERLAEAAQAAGFEKDERYALTQLTRLSPELTHHAERLNELGGAEEDAAAEVLPEFEPAAPVQAEAQAEEASPDAEDRSLADGETEFEWNSVADMAKLRNDSPSEDAVHSERGFTFEAVVAEELQSSSDQAVEASSPDDEDRHAMIRAQELESVDFYIAQGYTDIAVDTLDLWRENSEHTHIQRRESSSKIHAGGSLVAEPEPTFEPRRRRLEPSPAMLLPEANGTQRACLKLSILVWLKFFIIQS